MISVVGEEGLPLVKELGAKDNISEFDLADKVKKDIKIVRKMLYLLYNHNLVSFTRKKDKQKGWYIYYWTLLPDSIRFSYIKKKKELLERLKKRLDEETQEIFFVCTNNCVRLNFDQGMDFEFRCPECGELISQDENKKTTEHLKKKTEEIEKEIGQLIQQRTERRKKVNEKKTEVETKKRASKKNKPKAVKNKVPKKNKVVKQKTKKLTIKKSTVKKKTVKSKKSKK